MLDGKDFEHVRTIGRALAQAIQEDKHTPRTIHSEYFEIRFFKKGTVHLKWRRYHLLEQFTLTAAQGRRWLGFDHDAPNTHAHRSEPVQQTEPSGVAGEGRDSDHGDQRTDLPTLWASEG